MLAQRRSKRRNRFGKLPIKFRDTINWQSESRVRVMRGLERVYINNIKEIKDGWITNESSVPSGTESTTIKEEQA